MGASKRNAGIVAPGLVKAVAPPEAPTEEMPQKEEKVRSTCLHSQLHKTKLCAYHLKGNCQYGSSCAFAHSCTELQATPDLRKTCLCMKFMEGEGCDDPDCSFAHGEDELRSTGMFFKKTLCIWNENGKCRNGDQCRFAHGVGELRGSLQQAALKGKATKNLAEKATAPATAGKRRQMAAVQGGAGYSSGQGSEPMKVLPHSNFVAPAPMPMTQNMQAELDGLRHHIAALSMRCSEIKHQMLLPDRAQLEEMGLGGMNPRAALSPYAGVWSGNADMVNMMNAKVAAMLLGGSNVPMSYGSKGLQGIHIPNPPGFGDDADGADWMQSLPVYPGMGA